MIQQKIEAKLSQREFERLIARYPQQSSLLKSHSSPHGQKVVVDVDSLALGNSRPVDRGLLDELYSSAYSLQENRFLSYFLQLNEILKLSRSRTNDILEIGRGRGIFEALIKNFRYNLVSLDVDPNCGADVLGDVRKLPFEPKSFDLICAFEVLEHLPFQYFPVAVKEMARCARHYVFLSFPCRINSFYFHMSLRLFPRLLNNFSFNWRWLQALPLRGADQNEKELMARQDAHNPHFWEVNRKSFPKKRIKDELKNCGLTVVKDFHNPYYPYHYFILCEVK
jgi:hypothetical protein